MPIVCTTSPTFRSWLKRKETGADPHGRLLAAGSPALVAYRCPAGVWTLGWGATGTDIKPGTRWTLADCEARLAHDLRRFELIVCDRIGNAPTTQGQFDGLTGFTYNAGPEALRTSTLLKRHLARDYAGAAAEFAKWNKGHVNGRLVVLDGLTTRRAEEAAFYKGG